MCGIFDIAACFTPIMDFFSSIGFWLYWGGIYAGVLAVCWLLGWFFQSLRPFCGVVILVLTAFIVGLWKGRGSKKTTQRPAPQPQRQEQSDPFAWMWNWK